jgi:hypothetical protein
MDVMVYGKKAQTLLDQTFGIAQARLLCLALVSDLPSALALSLPHPRPVSSFSNSTSIATNLDNNFRNYNGEPVENKVYFNSNSMCQSERHVELLGIFVLFFLSALYFSNQLLRFVYYVKEKFKCLCLGRAIS